MEIFELKAYKLGELIEPFYQACGIPNLKLEDVSGINRAKEFFEPAKQVGADTSNYQIVPQGYFACNLMHVGRDVVLPISCNHSERNKIVSPAYTVFYIKDEDIILKEYFFMMLKSDEKDRFFWFHTDSSVRDGMSWEDFTSLEINLPSIDVQKKYVAIYKAMQRNLAVYQAKVDDLKLVCDGFLDKLKNENKKIKIGDFIVQSDLRNEDGQLKVESVKGITTSKQFIETKANMHEVSLKNYKVVNPNQFAYVSDTSRRGDKISLALNTSNESLLVSSITTIFKIINEEKLSPQYLMMFFSRSEFDRYSRYYSWGSAREAFDWNEMCNVEIPIPDITIQESIVQIYNAYQKRKAIAEKMKAQINSICPVLIKGAIQEGGSA